MMLTPRRQRHAYDADSTPNLYSSHFSLQFQSSRLWGYYCEEHRQSAVDKLSVLCMFKPGHSSGTVCHVGIGKCGDRAMRQHVKFQAPSPVPHPRILHHSTTIHPRFKRPRPRDLAFNSNRTAEPARMVSKPPSAIAHQHVLPF